MMINKDGCLKPVSNEEWWKASLTLKGTMDIVGGKWKLALISILWSGNFKFRELF